MSLAKQAAEKVAKGGHGGRDVPKKVEEMAKAMMEDEGYSKDKAYAIAQDRYNKMKD